MFHINKYVFRIVFLITTSCYSQNNPSEKKPPNIVFIFSDDHATNAISAYGGLFTELAPTPNIDRIANEGALLENALCTNAICGPSRAAILTGTYSHVNGYYKNYKGGGLIIYNGPILKLYKMQATKQLWLVNGI